MGIKHSLPPQRLMIRTIDMPQGYRTILTDDRGIPLPNQKRTRVEYDADGLAEVTVTFRVDGDMIQHLPDYMEAHSDKPSPPTFRNFS